METSAADHPASNRSRVDGAARQLHRMGSKCGICEWECAGYLSQKCKGFRAASVVLQPGHRPHSQIPYAGSESIVLAVLGDRNRNSGRIETQGYPRSRQHYWFTGWAVRLVSAGGLWKRLAARNGPGAVGSKPSALTSLTQYSRPAPGDGVTVAHTAGHATRVGWEIEMEAKFTPGPWQHNHLDFLQICDADGEVRGCAPIAHIAGGKNGETRAEARANARLIAAAPDMAETLDWIFSLVNSDEWYDGNDLQNISDRILAVRAKATGASHE